VIKSLCTLGLNIRNIIGQSYDGAANISGKYAGLQALIKTGTPKSRFTHCYASNVPQVSPGVDDDLAAPW